MHFKHLARFGGKSHGRQDLQGEKNNNNNNEADSFFRLNFNAYINVDNREKARAINKTTTTTKANLVGRKTSKFYSGATKMRNASFHQGENERQRKTKVNQGTQTFPP